MGKLTAGERRKLPKKDFAAPSTKSDHGGKGGYPIPDKSHARMALAMVSKYGTPTEKNEVREKVHKKFPEIGKKKKRR